MNLCNFCTHLTFDLILRLGGILRLGIHPSVFSYISRDTLSMLAKMYSKLPTYCFGSSDWQLLPKLSAFKAFGVILTGHFENFEG